MINQWIQDIHIYAPSSFIITDTLGVVFVLWGYRSGLITDMSGEEKSDYFVSDQLNEEKE